MAGEMFILDMGEPVNIDDLAKQMIVLSGKKSNVDIDVIYTGLRPGEKMDEELFYEKESLQNKYVPKRLIDRPKMGFSVPLDSWLRGPLRDWADSLLEPSQLNEDSMFCAKIVVKRWQEHLSGKRNWQYSLWNILMAQSWRKQWGV